MTVERVGAGAPQHLGPGQPLQAAEAPLNWYVSSRTSLKLINLTYLVKMKEYILFILKTEMCRVRFQDFNL